MRSAVTALHVMVDHFAMRRRHPHANAVDLLRLHAALNDLPQRLSGRHCLSRGAPRLERNFGQHRACAQALRELAWTGGDSIDTVKKVALDQAEIRREPRLRRKRGGQSVAGGIPDRQPTRRAQCMVLAHAGSGKRERKSKRIRALLRIELQEPRCGGRNPERRREIGWPEAAVEHRRAVDRAAEPDHGFIARKNCGLSIARCNRRHCSRQAQNGRNDDCARGRHGRQMDVVDLAQACQRTARRDIKRQGGAGILPHLIAKPQQQPTLSRRRAGDQGADSINEVDFHALPELF